jgi:hypothetical protein
MFLTEFFGFFSLSALSTWGFLMAFFFNVFIYSLNIKRKTTALLSSFIMMVSYSTSDYFFTWFSIYNTTYLDWVFYDLTTITLLILAYKLIKTSTASLLYLITGLFINSVLAFLMYLDTSIYSNYKPWIFWDIYACGVLIIDSLMIVSLIVDRDFLGLHIIKNKIYNWKISTV